MTLRPASEGDLPRIVEIYNASIPHRESTADIDPVTVDERLTWFRAHRPERPILVCEVGTGIGAWLSFEDFYGRAAYAHTAELSLYVAPEMQGRGLGRALIGQAIEIARGIGIRSVVGYVFAHNAPSLRLLRGAGFAEWGRLPKVAEMDRNEYDLLILGKRLQ